MFQVLAKLWLADEGTVGGVVEKVIEKSPEYP